MVYINYLLNITVFDMKIYDIVGILWL